MLMSDVLINVAVLDFRNGIGGGNSANRFPGDNFSNVEEVVNCTVIQR